ncbi:hypothetical protein ADK38_25180, partial [Streptomyces varsoviensis]
LPVLGPVPEQQRQWRSLLPELAGAYVLDTTHYGIVRPPEVRAIADAVNAAWTEHAAPPDSVPPPGPAPLPDTAAR